MWWSSGVGQAVWKWHSKDSVLELQWERRFQNTIWLSWLANPLEVISSTVLEKSLIPIPGDSLASLDTLGLIHWQRIVPWVSGLSPVFVFPLHLPCVWVSGSYWVCCLYQEIEILIVLGAGQSHLCCFPWLRELCRKQGSTNNFLWSVSKYLDFLGHICF